MLTLTLFTVLMFVVFGKMCLLAFRMTWGLGKILFSILFLPIILIGLVIAGLIRIAMPVLAVIGVILLIRSLMERSEKNI